MPAAKTTAIFLTGVTGFLGRYLLYQLCEADWVDEIYVLIRPKRDSSPEERFKEVLNDPLYEAARKQGVKFNNIHVISGDIQQPNLGMSSKDLNFLASRITLVLHNAAALSFAAHIQDALKANTIPTWNLYQFCCDVFEHKPPFLLVSTAATNSHLGTIPERITEFSVPAETLFNFCKDLPPERCSEISKFLKEDRLDSYGFSKGLVERMIFEHQESGETSVPVAFIRPGGIISAQGGPLVGWVHKTCFYAQLGYFIYAGQLPFFLAKRDQDLNMAPVDLIGNSIMASLMDLREAKKNDNISVRVVNASTPCVDGVSFGLILDVASEKYSELVPIAEEAAPGAKFRQTMPRSPLFLQSVWLFQFLYFVCISIPLFFYTLFMGKTSKSSVKFAKLASFLYKYVLVLEPYISRNIQLESGEDKKLQEKYGSKYQISAQNVDKKDFVFIFLKSLAKYIVPSMERKKQRLLGTKKTT